MGDLLIVAICLVVLLFVYLGIYTHITLKRKNKFINETIQSKSKALDYWRERAESIEASVEKQYAVKIRKITHRYTTHFSAYELNIIMGAIMDSIPALNSYIHSEKLSIINSYLKVYQKASQYASVIRDGESKGAEIECDDFDIDGNIIIDKPIT